MPRTLLLLFVVFTGCYAEEVDDKLDREPFFDLAAYINAQVDSLTELGPEATKTIVLNGQREEQQRNDIDFASDLRVFREADINRPAWLDKYTIDRTTEKGLRTETYTSLDSSLQTRQLRITFENEVPTLVEVFRRTGTVLSDGNHYLSYRPERGYRMRTEQDNRFGDDLDATITVAW